MWVGNAYIHTLHEMAAAILGTRADQLRLADGDGHAAVRPRLRHQVQARDDAAAGVGHDGAVAGAKGGVAALVEVAGPRAHVVVGLVAVLRAQDVADERGHRLGVGRGARA